MFTALILACALNPDGSTNTDVCVGISSPYVWLNVESCLTSLEAGFSAVESRGWVVQKYQCYNWKEDEGSTL